MHAFISSIPPSSIQFIHSSFIHPFNRPSIPHQSIHPFNSFIPPIHPSSSIHTSINPSIHPAAGDLLVCCCCSIGTLEGVHGGSSSVLWSLAAHEAN
jgi:hypothetical protein